MEPISDDDYPRKLPNNTPSTDGNHPKPKRQMKTPFQLETLEKVYASDTYPSEAVRAELSEKLGLTDRQLQMWFCHKRLKDKKETGNKEHEPKKPPIMESPMHYFRAVDHSNSASESRSDSSPFAEPRMDVPDDFPLGRRHHESSPQSLVELRAIACIETQLGEPIREDGPILGMHFDSLPPDAFCAPIGSAAEQQKRTGHSYGSKLYEQHDVKSGKVTRLLHDYRIPQDKSSIRSDTYGQVDQTHFHDSSVNTHRERSSLLVHENNFMPRTHATKGHTSRGFIHPQHGSKGKAFSSPYSGDECIPQHKSSTVNRVNNQVSGHLLAGAENMDKGLFFHAEADLQRKHKSCEARFVREVDIPESPNQKDPEKQEHVKRKSEERMRKEMERFDRDRRKEEERLVREKQREEERSLREQKREIERKEKFMQKENLRAERMRQREELRKEKESVRRKAAVEKATTRRIAKESMDLIEDEQLELMELAAASKGLPSMIHLDHDTLQNLELFRDSLSLYPPKSLQLKRPFSIQPWVDSEENVANLFMVWRFLISFADILGMWPFTLDELFQAFHDHESRLLSEIHIALLKIIIKDIEDVARTPSTGLGTNQYSFPNPESGHPQIVEGAYAWGFNIRSWKQHLNPLTWLEIFRQLALSAGFGPQLKDKTGAWAYSSFKEEGKVREDVVSTLRSGSAAVNAFALMRERGLLAPRKSRHRLTPGTVKFAAFHLLSLEGGEGLNVLDLAEKIQKSGLRDLSTSKTPEASISVALTRDTKLFERVAPSTYCVRDPYRKDPADAEAILSAARKKIRTFENGFLAEDVDVDKEEDSESDADDDVELEGFATPLGANKDADHSIEVEACSGTGRNKDCDGVVENQNKSENQVSVFPMNGSDDGNKESSKQQCIAGEDVGASSFVLESNDIDDCMPAGESWVQGLSEGEYYHLSVEERLHALAALVGIVNEGNSTRAVLEDRLDAASALKKQIWAAAQVDKSCIREDIISFPVLMESKTEFKPNSPAVDGSQSPFPGLDINNGVSPSIVGDEKPLLVSQSLMELNNLPVERASIANDHSNVANNYSVQDHELGSKRSRSQLKSYVGHIAEEMCVYRSLPLGQDRRHNRYWQFVASASRNDPCSGKIFVELQGVAWRLIDSEKSFDTLISSLDTRGIRESHLSVMLHRIETRFKENVRRDLQCYYGVNKSGITFKNEVFEITSSPDSMLCGMNSDSLDAPLLEKNESETEAALVRHQDFWRWTWQECFSSLKQNALKHLKKEREQLLVFCDLCVTCYLPEESHCPSCHQMISTADSGFSVSEHIDRCEERMNLIPSDVRINSCSPMCVTLLKAGIAFVETYIPVEALASHWTESYRRSWGARLNASSSSEELLEIVTQLEHGVKLDYLSSSFETTKELLSSCHSSQFVSFVSTDPGSVSVLPWIPRTTAAVALRLFMLDAAIIRENHQKPEPFEDTDAKLHAKLPPKYSSNKNKEFEAKVVKNEYMEKENYGDPCSSNRGGNKRGRGEFEHGCGPKSKRKAAGWKLSGSSKQKSRVNGGNLSKKPRNKKRQPGQLGWGRRIRRKRGGRVVRTTSEEAIEDDDMINVKMNGLVDENRDYERMESDAGVEAEDSGDINYEVAGYDNDHGNSENLMDVSDEDVLNGGSGNENGLAFEDDREEDFMEESEVDESESSSSPSRED